jgi:hypothetical protein
MDSQGQRKIRTEQEQSDETDVHHHHTSEAHAAIFIINEVYHEETETTQDALRCIRTQNSSRKMSDRQILPISRPKTAQRQKML